jgi:hypothetical protein
MSGNAASNGAKKWAFATGNERAFAASTTTSAAIFLWNCSANKCLKTNQQKRKLPLNFDAFLTTF